jgi:hypothetical protein
VWIESQMNLVDKAKLMYQKFYEDSQLPCCEANGMKASY